MLAIAVALSLQQSLITVPMGYYTLGELGPLIEKQGPKLSIASNCRNDVYALRLKDVSLADFKQALVADERLTVRDKDDTIEIERNNATTALETAALRKYQKAIGDSIHRVYGIVAQRIRYIESVAKEKQDEERDRVTKSIPAIPEAAAIRTGIYMGSIGEVPFSQSATLAALTEPKGPPVLNKLLLTTFFETPALQSPNGSLETLRLGERLNMSPAERETFFRNMQFAAKITVDPLSLAASYRSAAYFKANAMVVSMAPRPSLLCPEEFRISITPEMVWDRATLQSIADRVRASDQAIEAASELKESNLDNLSQPTSAALLKAAEGSGSNLVCHVASFADYRLSPASLGSLTSVIKDANSDGIDLDWMTEGVRERVAPIDDEERFSPAFHPLRRFTVAAKGRVYVIRNEMRFLDGWSATPAPPTAFANSVLNGKAVPMSQIAAHALSLNLKSWPSSLFSTRYLEFCNPVSFRPFAIATRSAAVKAAIGSLRRGESRSVPYMELDQATRAAFDQSISECSSLNDSCISEEGSPDPMMAPITLGDMDRKELSIMIIESGRGYLFLLMRRGEVPLWASLLRNSDVRS